MVRFPQVESDHPVSPNLLTCNSEPNPDKVAGHEAKLPPEHSAEFKNGWTWISTTPYATVLKIEEPWFDSRRSKAPTPFPQTS